jgi:iron complex transport system ATP-binding protein
MERALIELEGAVVRYRSGVTIGPLDLRVAPAELVMLTGPNGSGKTTLLELAGGRLRPAAGRVGRPPGRAALAVLPQGHSFGEEAPVTVDDVVGFGTLAHGWLRRPDRARCAAALARVGAAPLAGRLFRELSGGQRQLVQLARLVAQGGALWLLDEPLAGLDPDWRARVVAVLDALHREDRIAMLLVNHQHDAVPAGCRRVVALAGGRIAADGPPAEVLA